ncbi:MAG: energy-coupling factor ABC transporter substrate-binding protein, partial [Deltaproteobacteria bacterium]|nr:energy-coupling factor ABC transporter substrate-binding protein [Deltaproteobacteria bacterium]
MSNPARGCLLAAVAALAIIPLALGCGDSDDDPP